MRVWGAIGWIVVGIGVGQWLATAHTLDQEQAKDKVITALVQPSADTSLLGIQYVSTLDEEIRSGNILVDGQDHVILEVPGEEPLRIERDNIAKIERAVTLISTTRPIEEVLKDSDATEQLRQNLVVAKPAIDSVIQKNQIAGMGDAFRLSAILGLLLGAFCFFLPHTPPRRGREKFAAAEAFSEIMKSPALRVIFLVAIPIACIHQFYFVHTAGFLNSLSIDADWINKIFGVGGGGLMTIGQIAETLVLAVMGVIAVKMKRKPLLVIGLLAYTLRFAAFAYAPSAGFVLPALALHGVCFGCFFFICFLVVDENTSTDVRATTQSLFNLIIMGVGTIVGNIVAGAVADSATTNKVTDYEKLFSVPMFGTIACLVILVLFYREGKRDTVVA